MKERPILFNADMVRAILDGRKTHTRRVVKLDLANNLEDGWGDEVQMIETDETTMGGLPVTEFCPYGRVGDRLWVRETWQTSRSLDHVSPSGLASGAPVLYLADQWNDGYPAGFDKGKGRPSIFMPRWASRITLEITGVRVERLQEITEADAQDEGCERIELGPFEICGMPVHPMTSTYKESFKVLWDSINGDRKDNHGNRLPYAWNDNPWVWVVEFKKEQN